VLLAKLAKSFFMLSASCSSLLNLVRFGSGEGELSSSSGCLAVYYQFFLDLLQVTGGGAGTEKMRMVPYRLQMEGGESIHSNPKRNTQKNINSVPVNRNMNNDQAQGTIGEPQDTWIPSQWGQDIHRTQTCYDGQNKTV
jgi:hypothetical protein